MLELLADPNKIQQFQVFVECNGIHGDHPTSFELILDDWSKRKGEILPSGLPEVSGGELFQKPDTSGRPLRR